MKAKVRQLCSELKNTKKEYKCISEFITKVNSLADSLTSACEVIEDSYLIDILLDGFPKEYNSFVMMIFNKTQSPSLTDIESLLLIRKSQLDKFKQELAIANITANVSQASAHSNPKKDKDSAHAQGTQGNYIQNFNNRGHRRHGRTHGHG